MNKLSYIIVFGLFGIKENIVGVNFIPEELASFVVGSSIGKTTVLKLLNAILMPTKENLDTIARINFDTIKLKFSNGADASISKHTFKEDLGKVRQVSGGMISNLMNCEESLASEYSDHILRNMTFATDIQRSVFLHVINHSNMADKHVVFDDDGRISITLDYYGNEYKGYPMDILSRGEKNTLLLYYYLITKIPNKVGTSYLQLIDTPEICMHEDAQTDFFNNLKYINQELGRGDEFQYVIATNSPAIKYRYAYLMCGIQRIKED